MSKRIAAVAAAVLLSLACMVFAVLGGGVAQLPSGELRSAYPGYDEVASWNFMAGQYRSLRDAGKNPRLVFGSSELKSKTAGAAHPGRLFADGRYGETSVIAGRAGVNDLWQAIEVGAFAPEMPREDRHAVIFVSMQWFMCYRDPSSTFPGVFSQGAYDAFMGNEAISDDVKSRVAERVRAYGVPDAEVSGEGPLVQATSGIDRAASSLASDVRLAASLRWKDAHREPARTEGGSRMPMDHGLAAPDGGAGAPGAHGSSTDFAPDWQALIAEGRACAERASQGNEYGFYDSWYRSSYRGWLAGAQKNWEVADGEYWSAEELEDFELMLEVCRQTGVEPLVVIQPVKGAAYDQTAYTRDVRADYYDMIRTACLRAGARVADFSDKEYDPFFLRDYSHPSAYGSACYSQAMWEFWTASE